ncbi:NUDIX hydrolase [Allokutzneria oryzae]|uniref:NUDIX domain-containing protein n=1 Tax=Allokutzneria oryzae TaxID=1378989 RepID=A0ABV6A5G5_9PSEU
MSHTEYPPFAVTADLVVLTIREDALCALLVRRAADPFAGCWALPGGFVGEDEDTDAAARRELEEETGLADGTVHLEQLASYGAPGRDPRMRVVTIAYLALAPDLPAPTAGSDAADARWWPVEELLADPGRLAFDHHRILSDGVARARAMPENATVFCRPEFTVAELRRACEVVMGTPLDPRNFHRKVTGRPGFLAPTGTMTTRDGGRPARLYRRSLVSRSSQSSDDFSTAPVR